MVLPLRGPWQPGTAIQVWLASSCLGMQLKACCPLAWLAWPTQEQWGCVTQTGKGTLSGLC